MDDEFHVDMYGPSGRIAHPFMYNYYMKGIRKLKGEVELMETAIVPIDTPELCNAFNELVDKGVFTIERELKIVKINPEVLEDTITDWTVELQFVEMLKKLEEQGLFNEILHIAVEITEDEKK